MVYSSGHGEWLVRAYRDRLGPIPPDILEVVQEGDGRDLLLVALHTALIFGVPITDWQLPEAPLAGYIDQQGLHVARSSFNQRVIDYRFPRAEDLEWD